MRSVLITPATIEPITVEDLKTYPEIRIDSAEHSQDHILAAHLKAAIRAYESYSGRVMCSSAWDAYLDEWPDEYIELPAPLQTVASINYRDTAGTWQIMDAADYIVDTSNAVYGRVALAYGESWPDIYSEINPIRIRYVAGYADVEDIPQEIIQGLLLKVQELYDGVQADSYGRPTGRLNYEALWAADARLPI